MSMAKTRLRRCAQDIPRCRLVTVASEEIQQVVEGVKAAKAVHDVAEKLGIEMPIVNQVYRILYEGLSPREAVAALMSRELKPESA
jgi:glycerol-3-phosphate dehydrogenase (NAD(P)+)